MNYVIGSAITLVSEIPTSLTSGSTAIVKSIVDPNGTAYAENESMTLALQSDGETYAFEYTFQTTDGTHDPGRYKFITQVTNGSRINVDRSYFYLREE